jgi:hypothetical protein
MNSTDSHADGSTFVGRKTTVGRFATYPTRTFLADALVEFREASLSAGCLMVPKHESQTKWICEISRF